MKRTNTRVTMLRAFIDPCSRFFTPLGGAYVSSIPLHCCFLTFPAVDFFSDQESYHDAFYVQRAFNQPGQSPLMTSYVLTSGFAPPITCVIANLEADVF